MKNAILLLSLAILFGCYGRRPPLKTGLEGKALPAFNLLLTDSATYINTGSIANSKPIVLFCFSPRCPYCRAQMDEIIGSMSSLNNIQFYIFTTWPFDEMKDFYKHFQLNKFSNLVVGLDYTNFFVDYFKAQGVPYMAIYGKDKKFKEAFMGNVYGSQIKEVAEN